MPKSYYTWTTQVGGTQYGKEAFPVRPDGERSLYMSYIKDNGLLVVDSFMSYPHVTTYVYNLPQKILLYTKHWQAKPLLQWIVKHVPVGECVRFFKDGSVTRSYYSCDNDESYTWGPDVEIECPLGYTPCSDKWGDNEDLRLAIEQREDECKKSAYAEWVSTRPDEVCEDCGFNTKYYSSCYCDADLDYYRRY